MKVSYYPGCSLHGTAREYGDSFRSLARFLGVELEELPDWTCCGASSAHVVDDALAFSLAARNLKIAAEQGKDLVVPCAACYQRLKRAEKGLNSGETTTVKQDNGIRIRHSADFIWETFGEKTISGKVRRPLKGLKPVCYYGCLTARPPDVTDAADAEDPQSMDDIVRNLGADVKNWSYKTDCCGGNLVLTRPEAAKTLIKGLLDMALEADANCIVVGCPMCHSNLDTKQGELTRDGGIEYNVPIYYFTELMDLAYGEKPVGGYVKRHITDARTLLLRCGLI